MVDKIYDFKKFEQEIIALWEKENAFVTNSPNIDPANNYSVIMPPPNVTGNLHVGHALNGTIQDILVRFERMRGKNILFQPGLDHAGIATQMVVERQLAAQGESDRYELGREKFIEKIWQWKEDFGGQIVNQYSRLGVSCDWSRQCFTMDKGSNEAVIKVFVTLYKDGLIYKNKRLVNWDPKLLTAISDLEVAVKEVKGHLWYVRYPLKDKVFNPLDDTTYVVVATTRPETLLGDSGLAVNPNDDRYQHIVNKLAILPLVGRCLPIVADEYVSIESGSGVVKMTPAHDFNDFEVGERHNLSVINILTEEAKLKLVDNDEFLQGLELNDNLQSLITQLEGKSTTDARNILVELLTKYEYIEKVEEHIHKVPHGDRSGVVIEPYLTEQWYLNVDSMSKQALKAVKDGDSKFIPSSWDKTYYNWLNEIRPWCISRQLWWGHQIPAWYGPDGKIFVEETEDMANKAALGYYGTKVSLVRDPDVLDTWFSSSLWPFSTLGWPNNTEVLNQYYPTNVLVTAFDIIFFWVARMMMMGLYFIGKVPFKNIYLHPLLRDKYGAKMSKSKGNVIDPLALMDSYGTDSLRFTLAIMSVQGRDVRLDESRVEGYRNFITKLWNATRFAEMHDCFSVDDFNPSAAKLAINQWILTELSNTRLQVETALEAYKFNEASLALYRFTWNSLCDWYIELAKPILMDENHLDRDEVRGCLRFCLEAVYKLLHPFMPFVTEFLWNNTLIEGKREKILALVSWPNYSFDYPESKTELTYLIDLISVIRSARAQMNVPASAQVPLWAVNLNQDLQNFLSRYELLIKRLARVSEIISSTAPAKDALQIIVGGDSYNILVGEFIDLGVEKARLQKKKDKLLAERMKLMAKLENPKFIANASEIVISNNKNRLNALDVEIEALSRALAGFI